MSKAYDKVKIVVELDVLVDCRLNPNRIQEIFKFVQKDLEKIHLQVAHDHELIIHNSTVKTIELYV